MQFDQEGAQIGESFSRKDLGSLRRAPQLARADLAPEPRSVLCSSILIVYATRRAAAYRHCKGASSCGADDQRTALSLALALMCIALDVVIHHT